MKRSLVIYGVLLALCITFSFTATVFAHADFVRADPPANSSLERAPDRLTLWFTEPLEEGLSEVQVFDSERNRVDQDDSRINPDDPESLIVSLQPLDPGVYTVAWKALSAVDGHLTRGTYNLFIGVSAAATAPPAAEEVSAAGPFETAVRWFNYLAATALAGALLFSPLILMPLAARIGQAQAVENATNRAQRRLLWTAWLLLLAATLAALVLQAAIVTEEGAGALFSADGARLVFETRYGTVWLLRLACLLGLAAAITQLNGRRRRYGWWAAALLSGGVLLTTSLNSHSAAAGAQALPATAADWLHQVAVAVWVGGLIAMVAVLPAALRSLQPQPRRQLLAQVIARFSTLAIAAVAVLLLTGIYQLWLHVGSLAALRETLYGQSLALKIAISLPLLLLGAANLLIVRPRLLRLKDGADQAAADRLGSRFGRLIRAEVALAALVLLATGLLTSLPPGRQSYARLQQTRPLAMEGQAGNLQVAVTVAPARPGPNTWTVEVHDAAGQPVDNAKRVSLTLSFLDEALGSTVIDAQPQGDGRYIAEEGALGLEGRWQAELLVRLPGEEDARTAFRFLVTQTSASEEDEQSESGPAARLPALNGSTLMALALVLIGIGLAVYIKRTLGLRSRDGKMLGLASLLVVVLGLYLLTDSGSGGMAVSRQAATNPFPPTGASLQQGEQIYRARCQVCHGATGGGDGPAAAGLNPPPADLRVHLAAGHTDAELFGWISRGIPGTAMPPFGNELSQEEIWHVVNFIRTFAAGSTQ